jgi:tRNA-splicing ligase RtcB
MTRSICADGHLGYAHPIGGIVAYRDQVSISGVGYDIACGNMAVRLDARAADLRARATELAGDIARAISFGVGRKNEIRVDHDLFDSPLWDDAGIADLKSKARAQLGTVGSGNHYVDLFEDESGFAWIGVHFGSRGLGHTTTTRALAAQGAAADMHSPPALVTARSDAGQSYLAGVELAGLYAYAGREWVIERVRAIIGGAVTDSVHNHHNFVWREQHGGDDFWVVRKGATPAFPGQRGFVGGSMGDDAVILEGVEGEASAAALYSTVHGAGRVMSRTDARGRMVTTARCAAEGCAFAVPWPTYEQARKTAGLKDGARFTLCPDHPDHPMRKHRARREGAIHHDAWMEWVAERGVTLAGGGIDEAPQAYRRLPKVLACHAATIRILHRLRPFVVVMAGADEFDPWKD